MRHKISIGVTAVVAVFAFVAMLGMTSVPASAQTETALYNFGVSPSDASVPSASLVFDAAGNLYGTTFGGGAHGFGTVFELIPTTGGGWREKVLHSFSNSGKDGYEPLAGLIFDGAGNLYGTTYQGGAHSAGIVFELSPLPSGVWNEKILHNFTPGTADGSNPRGGLVLDAAGNLYGTTQSGGPHNGGIVFELSPTKTGGWTEKLLHGFYVVNDGATPEAGVIFDAAGNLYGTTNAGGTANAGVAFKLTPTAHGPWAENILHEFSGNSTDGGNPEAGLVFDTAGNLYGTTLIGGAYNGGTVFEFTPSGGGSWTEAVLHNFDNNGTDGFLPTGALIFDGAGNLYGSTNQGGAGADGAVFELTPAGGGSWTENVIFGFNGTDGHYATSGLIFDAAGNLYGTTSQGGTHGSGNVFEITP